MRHTVTLRMIVKAENEDDAAAFARRKLQDTLNKWFCKDLDFSAPLPVGSLLFYYYQVEPCNTGTSAKAGGLESPPPSTTSGKSTGEAYHQAAD